MEELKKEFEEEFGRKPEYLFSAPGRVELSGNHTDHQHGKVLAAAIDLDIEAAVALNNSDYISIKTDKYGEHLIKFDDLKAKREELRKTPSIIRGVVARIKELTGKTIGFDVYTKCNVPNGSGLSSSAAYEVLFGTIINVLCDCKLTPIEIAQIGQYAENEYFGKPCGLMDQMASSVGNIISIDFMDTKNPKVESVEFDLSKSDYNLIIINCGADHANLTDEYASITDELKKVCSVFDKNWIREISEEEFYLKISEVRRVSGDRGVLRAVHIYEENKRVDKQIEALNNNDIETFLKYVKESGKSSWMLLQNVIPTGASFNQELAFALTIVEKILKDRGVCRVQGGGFAGTLQAYVKKNYTDSFINEVEKILGKGSCHKVLIRKDGGILEKKFD